MVKDWPWKEIKKNKFWYEYHRLMDKARNRKRPKQSERHHVLPIALDGAGTELVRLTYAEHFHAHELLVNFCTGLSLIKMLHALGHMTFKSKINQRRPSARQYAIAREANSLALALRAKNQWLDPEYRERMIRAQRAPWQDPDRRINMIILRRAIWDPNSSSGKRLRKMVKRRFTGKRRSTQSNKKTSIAMRAWHNLPENKAKHRAGVKLSYDDDLRAQRSVKSLKLWSNSEHRSRMSAVTAARWKDPEYRARMRKLKRRPDGTFLPRA